MYNALSLTLTGTDQFSHLIRVLCAYALMISAFTDAFVSHSQTSHEQIYHLVLVEALQVGV